MVMVEAMACGTPVIGFSRGSVPEVIDQSVTGLKVSTKDEMVQAVREVGGIDRRRCREHAFSRFDVSNIAQHYITLTK